MTPRLQALLIVAASWLFCGWLLIGCATKPISAPSTAYVQGDIQRAQTATSQADAKAEVIYQWIKSQK